MSSLWFTIDGDAVNDACGRLEWFGLFLIASGVLGLLFGFFWVAFAGLCVVIGVGTWGSILLLVGAGGLGPMIGSALVLWLGISKRVRAARLRELRTLSHASGGVTVEQATTMMGSSMAAQRLLRRACELGVAAPAVPGR
jgi:hypothetical protein